MVTLSVLAQLDIISTASGGAIHAVSDAVDPFVFRLSIFVSQCVSAITWCGR